MQKVKVREQMFSMISEWQQSGVSQKDYCEERHIRYHVFHYWYKCFRNAQSTGENEGFVALNVQTLPSVSSSCAAELLLTDGRRVIFHQPVSCDYLKALIS